MESAIIDQLVLQSKPNASIENSPWQELKSILTINLLNKSNNKYWQNYEIKIQTPQRDFYWEQENLLFYKDEKKDEWQNFKINLKEFLFNNKKNKYIFEPIEPHFQLILERNKYSPQDIKTYFWFDIGNINNQAYYTWDSLGIRFYLDIISCDSFLKD